MSKLAVVLCALFCVSAINAATIPVHGDATQTIVDIANSLGEDIVMDAAAQLNIAKTTLDVILAEAIQKVKDYIMNSPDVKYILEQYQEVSAGMSTYLEKALNIIVTCAKNEISNRLQSKMEHIIGNIHLQPEGDSHENVPSIQSESDVVPVPLVEIDVDHL